MAWSRSSTRSTISVSQTHEGWKIIRTRYDDGGHSGGSMERPALQKLLDEVCARHIDVIVVHKVDPLTRSLADFAKLVKLFDAHKVSFVSVTQAFNTTTSIGRVTPQRASVLRSVRARGHPRADPGQHSRLG
jgi:DNA invertase Pin-like site-specific DNA recombinase